jgi:hypothetical protein
MANMIKHAEQTTLMQQDNTVCLETNIGGWKQEKHKLCQLYGINTIRMGSNDNGMFALCNIINSTGGTDLNPALGDV